MHICTRSARPSATRYAGLRLAAPTRLGFTTADNELLRDVHERMPVILTRDAEAAWLDSKTQDTAALLALLKQYPAEEMEFYPVLRDVNSPTVDVPGNIEPVKTSG